MLICLGYYTIISVYKEYRKLIRRLTTSCDFFIIQSGWIHVKYVRGFPTNGLCGALTFCIFWPKLRVLILKISHNLSVILKYIVVTRPLWNQNRCWNWVIDTIRYSILAWQIGKTSSFWNVFGKVKVRALHVLVMLQVTRNVGFFVDNFGWDQFSSWFPSIFVFNQQHPL